MRLLAGIPLVVGTTALVVALAGCSAKGGDTSADPVKGKQLFVQRCGSCHVLSRAGTKGTTGPNLDAAFSPARPGRVRTGGNPRHRLQQNPYSEPPGRVAGQPVNRRQP